MEELEEDWIAEDGCEPASETTAEQKQLKECLDFVASFVGFVCRGSDGDGICSHGKAKLILNCPGFFSTGSTKGLKAGESGKRGTFCGDLSGHGCLRLGTGIPGRESQSQQQEF